MADKRMLNYAEAGNYLGVSERQMEKLAADGQVLKVKIGARVLFDVNDLDAYVERIKKAAS